VKEKIPIFTTESIQSNNTNIQELTELGQEGELFHLSSPSLKKEIEHVHEHLQSEQEQSKFKNENELRTHIGSLEQRLAAFEQQLAELRQQFLQFTAQRSNSKV
jgi:predicted  nucleic acid-binding Zn-ribbon protein